MGHSLRRLCIAAFCAVLLAVPARASTASCVIPERMHLSALTFSYDTDLGPIEKRLATEGFDAVAKSLPLNYASDVGWFTPQQLAGTQYAPAAALRAGATARMSLQLSPGFVHVDQVVPEMSCDRAIELHPKEAWPRLARAELEMNSGAYAAAKSDYQVAAQSTDRRFAQTAQYGLASIQYREGDYRNALASADVAVGSNSGDAYTLKALIEEAIGDDDLATADAAQGFSQYNGNEQDPSPATYALALAYSDLGFFAASDDQLETVLKRHPRDAQALLLRAFNKFSTGDAQGAARDFAAALKLRPQMEQPYLGLAMLDYSQGDVASAHRYAQQAFALYPHDVYTKLWLLITAGHAPSLPSHLQPCEPGFYAGIFALQQGHKQKANELLHTAANTCPYREYERATAQELLKRNRQHIL
jgi:tetratricopeptide (TPR) repeat protein